jgi:hypothetical protein
MRWGIPAAGFAVLALTAQQPLSAQESLPAQQPAKSFFVEALGGAVVPTFDIADVAKTGGALGGTLGYRLNDRWVLMGEFDYGKHNLKAASDVDLNTLHYIAKVGYSLTGPKERGWEALVNLGAGAVTFDLAGPSKFTYFAINAGAKIAYNFNRSLAFVISPQGDIAFSKEAELTTNNAWVWPVTAGFRASF